MSATQPPADAVEAAMIAVLARVHEIGGNKAAAFTLRQVGPVGQVLEDQLAAIATLRPAIIAEERAATVAWLRHERLTPCWADLGKVADAIERGDHEQKGPSRG